MLLLVVVSRFLFLMSLLNWFYGLEKVKCWLGVVLYSIGELVLFGLCCMVRCVVCVCG